MATREIEIKGMNELLTTLQEILDLLLLATSEDEDDEGNGGG